MRQKRDFKQDSRKTYTEYINETGDKELSYLEYVKIIQGFNLKVRDYTLETGVPVKLPHGFGYITVNRKKPVRKAIIMMAPGVFEERKITSFIDWPETKKQGKYIYHTNDHTDGYKFHIKWFRQMAHIKYRTIWIFRAYRDYSRLLKHYLTMPKYRNIYGEWKDMV